MKKKFQIFVNLGHSILILHVIIKFNIVINYILEVTCEIKSKNLCDQKNLKQHGIVNVNINPSKLNIYSAALITIVTSAAE